MEKNRIIEKKKVIENDGTKLHPRKRKLASEWVPKQSSHHNVNLELDPKDYISRLPNCILYHIISKLPLEFAVQTSCLSTLWKDVWQKALLVMVEDPSIEDIDITLTNFVEQLPEFNRPTQNRGFKFNFGRGRFLLVAIASNNRLVFDFSSAEEQELARPFDLLLPLNYKRPSRELIEVKSLHLKSVSPLACKAVSSLLSKKKLPFLKSLTIEKCKGLQSLEIKTNEEAAYGLLTLIVLDCPKLELITLLKKRDNFKSFRYRGRSVIYHGAHPEDLMLDFRQGLGYKYKQGKDIDDHLVSFLDTIQQCRSLTICGWFFQIDPSCYKLTKTWKLISRDSTSRQILKHLKLVKLEGFPNEKVEIMLVRRLIPLFDETPTIIAKSLDGTRLRQLEVSYRFEELEESIQT
ncbi:hypothetical protein COLO4_26933 [Corchorus olitorius]|uniref:F-box domain-containing protein n=1 Tax=Corchorus olitorius TaxID=93759 RepID=A0A1R3HTG4_9ROSI|nr:hypothetical protein COLO4_26933 [Corchorus olitorius]